jgi:hypothetical protein
MSVALVATDMIPVLNLGRALFVSGTAARSRR